jgi:hypothetical protein
MKTKHDCMLIDFTAEWFHRRTLHYLDTDDKEMASITSNLLEGYLDGLWEVLSFEDGEPVMTLSSLGKSLVQSQKGNNNILLDEAQTYDDDPEYSWPDSTSPLGGPLIEE